MDNPIRRALEGWREEQWAQKVMVYDDAGTIRMCLLGRLGMTQCDQRAADLVGKTIAELYPGFSEFIPSWNDQPGRTFDEVVAVMEKAAVRWDEENL